MKNNIIKEYNGENVKLVKRFNKKLPSAQGMAIYGDEIFQLYHTGFCAVHSLLDDSLEPDTLFHLGSYNDGVPSREYANHANQCMFSTNHCGNNPLPLFYLTSGYGIGANEDGYFYRCEVENIELERDENGKATRGKCTHLQTISYKDRKLEGTDWVQPCWGCPAWFVDSVTGYVYMLSCKYRATEEFKEYYSQNMYIITKFPMPDPFGEKKVTFSPKDILDQFICPFDIPFTQGGMIRGNKLYYTFGHGDSQYPDGVRVFDLDKKCVCAKIDLSHSIMGNEELECCAFHNQEFLVNTNAKIGGFYTLGSIFTED